MREKTRFAVVAAVSATAGVIITSIIDRFALKQDLEFLGIIHSDVAKGLATFRREVEENKDENGPE